MALSRNKPQFDNLANLKGCIADYLHNLLTDAFAVIDDRQAAIDAGCLNWVAGIAMREVQRATRSSMHQLLHPAGPDAEPIPELEFDQTLGL